MTYEVVITRPAEKQLLEAALWWSEHRSADQALRWYEGFLEALYLLQDNPERCPLARENDQFEVELRDLHYGLGPRPTHRAVFKVEGDRVLVLAIRHRSQQDVTPGDI
jgi:plasmid stabilization system protein ParE